MLRLPRIAVLAGLAACSQGYAVVSVEEAATGKGLPDVYQIRSTVTDGTATAVGSYQQQSPIAFAPPPTYVVKIPSSATSLSVLVEGLDQLGETVLARGFATQSFAAGASPVAVTVQLHPPCGAATDCAPSAFCAGTVNCEFTFVADAGACVSLAPPAPPAFATACGNDGGRCDATLSCVVPWTQCGDGIQGTDHLPDGGTFTEQCDWGTAPPCSGPGGACNADTADQCRTDCTLPRCGDGIVDTGERCDLGAQNGTPGLCNPTCTLVGDAGLLAGNGDFYPDGGQCNSGCIQDGPGLQATFFGLAGLALVGSTLYVADSFNNAVRAVDLSTPQNLVTTFAGSTLPANYPGQGTDAGLFSPAGILALDGNLLVGTIANVEAVSVPAALVTTFAGAVTNSPGSSDGCAQPGLKNEPPYCAGPIDGAKFGRITALTYDGDDSLYAAEEIGDVRRIQLDAGLVSHVTAGGFPAGASYNLPTGLTWLGLDAGGALFLADTGDEVVKEIIPVDGDAGVVTTVAGEYATAGYADCNAACLAQGGQAEFSNPEGLCTDGKTIYLMDGTNRAVRQFDPITHAVTTVIGGPNSNSPFAFPFACAWDPIAKVLYVADSTPALSSVDPSPPYGNKIFVVR